MTILVKLHVLGDALTDIELRNKSMQDLTVTSNNTDTCPNIGTIKFAYEHTTSSSLLRKWIVDETIFRRCRQNFAKRIEEYSADLVQQVALKLIQQTETIDGEDFLAKVSDYLEKLDA